MLSSGRDRSESHRRLESRLVLLGLLSDISIKYVLPIDHRLFIDEQRESAVTLSWRIENDVLSEVRPIASGEVEGASTDGEPVGGVAN